MIDEMIHKFADMCEDSFNKNPGYWQQFDYPDYGGLPKVVYQHFYSHFVDIIQEFIHYELGHGDQFDSELLIHYIRENCSINEVEASLEGVREIEV